MYPRAFLMPRHCNRVAASLAPEDAEIAFNLAAVLEACGFLEEALEQYKRSKEFGVDRAAMHIRNVCPTLSDVQCSLTDILCR